MRTGLVADALKAALVARGSLRSAIVHADHGAQYTSKDFATLCGNLGVVQSLGAVGASADNALAESLNATLKGETLAGATTFTNARTVGASTPTTFDRSEHQGVDGPGPAASSTIRRAQPTRT